VVVNYLDFECVSFPPNKAQAKLVINANAMLAFTVTGKLLKVITRWDLQILYLDRAMQYTELLKS